METDDRYWGRDLVSYLKEQAVHPKDDVQMDRDRWLQFVLELAGTVWEKVVFDNLPEKDFEVEFKATYYSRTSVVARTAEEAEERLISDFRYYVSDSDGIEIAEPDYIDVLDITEESI